MDLTGIRRQDAWQAPAQLEEGRRAKAQLAAYSPKIRGGRSLRV